jgi:phospholipase/carboxylesterase
MQTTDHANDVTPPIELETGPNPTACVIWLHGLGADGSDFEPIVPELRLPRNLAVRFVFPHAPYRPVTINGGYIMRAWYDIEMTDSGFNQKVSHIRESEATINALVEEQIARGIPSTRIVLAGFSQGGAIALYSGLRFPQPLAGIMCLSAPIPYAGRLMQEAHAANARISIFMAHGTHDGVVPFAVGESAYRLLTTGGANIEWHVYNMEHSVVPAEIKDIGKWLSDVLK